MVNKPRKIGLLDIGLGVAIIVIAVLAANRLLSRPGSMKGTPTVPKGEKGELILTLEMRGTDPELAELVQPTADGAEGRLQR